MLLTTQKAFSLVELLIALVIIGVLTTFTIPKLLNPPNSTLSAKQTAVAQNTAYMLMAAFEQYRAANPDVSAMRASDLEPYINYVKKIDDGVYSIDGIEGEGGNTCTSTGPCYTLHNGGVLKYWNDRFCDGTPTGIPFAFTPTDTYSGTTSGRYKALRLFLYSDGTVRTGGTMKTNTVWKAGSGSTCSHMTSSVAEPDWFTGF